MDIQTVVILALLFFSVIVIVHVVIRLLFGLGDAQRRPVSEAEKVANPLYRFVTPDRLFQLTSGIGISCGGAFLSVLWLLGVPLWIALVVACVVGFITSRAPKAWYASRVKARRATFDRRLMDLTLGLANGLRAGANLSQAMDSVARNLGGPIAEEFGHLLHEHRFGKDMPECLENLARRMPSEELTLLTTSICISMQTGGSLAEMMDRISDTIRYRIDFKERLKTMTAQGRFEAMAMGSAPIIVMLILYFVNREMVMPLFTTSIGLCGLGAVMLLETIGFVVINMIVKVEV